MKLVVIIIFLLSVAKRERPVEDIPCRTDMECHEWAIENGIPEEEWP